MKKIVMLFAGLLILLCGALASADTLYIPASVDTVMEEAYAGDEGFDRLILPPGILEIGRNAFRGCGFDAVYLPPSLMVLGENAFDSDVTIYVCPDSPVERELYRQGRAYTPLLLPDSVTILNDGTEIVPGGQAAMQVTVEPARSDTAHLIWSSSDESVATVSAQGVVTGVGEGTAVIRAETLAGVSGSVAVTVAGRKSVCRALLVANVNYYGETARWNGGDIELLREMFASVNAPNGEPWQVTVMYDLYDTRMEAAIRDTFADTREGDVSLIHISSHGFLLLRNEGIGVRMSRGSEMTYITYPMLKEWTDKYIRGDTVLFLETCYAGAAIYPGYGKPFRAEGCYVLGACDTFEHCYSYNGQYNYFVRWLTTGVGSMAADSNKDGAVSLGELQAYTYERGSKVNAGTSDSPYHQLSVAYPVDSDYILFLRK
ncbi:MAG: Ig-like domain-containing protein [Clostridia bacterium]|nr:Ig-like domain-containing protein [Clostridia bacterium]